ENRTTEWTCVYDAERYIGVNERNHVYEYPSQSGLQWQIPGIYSRENNYVNNNGTTTFLATGSNVNVVGFVSNYDVGDIDWVKCCNNSYAIPQLEERRAPENTTLNNPVGDFLIYPNPANDHITVSF